MGSVVELINSIKSYKMGNKDIKQEPVVVGLPFTLTI